MLYKYKISERREEKKLNIQNISTKTNNTQIVNHDTKDLNRDLHN